MCFETVSLRLIRDSSLVPAIIFKQPLSFKSGFFRTSNIFHKAFKREITQTLDVNWYTVLLTLCKYIFKNKYYML